MKAIIVAAGMGSRLEHLTEDTPKCLLPVDGKSILQYQLDAYRAHDINDIHVVKGYKHEKIDLPDITYYLNASYKSNNILLSLMHAESAMDDTFMASYSDIIFHPDVVGRLKASGGSIAVVVDVGWKTQYVGRSDHPISEAEKVVFDEDGYVREIGKVIDHPDDARGEFIGLMKLSREGAEKFKEYYHQAAAAFTCKPFVRAAEFRKAYVTDLLQYMIDYGIKVQAVPIERGWYEVDTIQDITRVRTSEFVDKPS